MIPLNFLLIFFLEIPDFLTKEECDHIIRKATETGLALSEVKLPDEEITTDKFASERLFNLVKNAKNAKRCSFPVSSECRTQSFS